MVSLQLDIHMEFYSALKISKTYLFTISKSERNMMTMTVRGNVALWLAHFMTLAMFISIWCATKPPERQRNSILLLTQAPRFICGTKMKFDQMNLEVLFPAIAIRSEVIRTQSSSIPLASHSFLHRGSVGSLWKLTPLVLLLSLWRPTATQWTMLSTFVHKDRGKFVKCDVISLASITKIKMAPTVSKWRRFGRFLGARSRKLYIFGLNE